jgi:hypothetical protein
MTIDAFMGRLQRVKAQAGDKGFLASCPGHGEDKSPSLSVRCIDRKILLNCFAGCDVDRILSAMGLEAADLFDKDEPPKRQIQAEYDYRDAAGTLLFQVIRYTPKGFAQRRPDGSGKWIYDLQGVRRVVYKLPELKGQKAILWVEGERDVDRAWAFGIPATCNPMGAGKWDPSYAGQLTDAGVRRVAVIPDQDAPGEAHALTVAAGLLRAGLEVRVVRLPNLAPHGDLSDYLATGATKEDLLGLLRAAPLWTPPVQVPVEVTPEPRFVALGEQRYRMNLVAEGVTFEVNRLRRSSQELHGEMLVRVNGQFPHARSLPDGTLQVGDMNFSSVTARGTRAKLLGERAGDKGADWYGFVEEFVTTVIAAERKGKPAEVLADVEDEQEDSESWSIEGFPLLQQLPQIIFGDSATGKSYFSMWLAAKLSEMGVNVLYADWEFSQSEHKRRLARLFAPMPKNLLYIRCEHALRQETDHLLDVIQKHKIGYIVCDSIGFAVEGPAESQEGAAGYFRHLRQLRIGSLNIAHIPKVSDDNREATIFGSVFFKAGARSIWFIDRAKENPSGEVRFGLYHRKNNVGALLQPKGFKLVFRGERTHVEVINLKDVEELAAGYPLLERLKEILVQGPMTIKQLSEDLNAPIPQIRATLARHKSQFIHVGNKIGVGASGQADNAAEF